MIQDSVPDCMWGNWEISGPRRPSISAASRGGADISSAILLDACWCVNLKDDARVMKMKGRPAVAGYLDIMAGQDEGKWKEGEDKEISLLSRQRGMAVAVARMRLGT